MPTPRVFIIRHGQTEWSLSGQYTGNTDIPLTEKGVAQVTATAKIVFGPGKLIDPKQLAKAFVSPRTRAQKTLNILLNSNEEATGKTPDIEVTEDIREWEYGLYEGKLTKEIRLERKQRGLDKEREWDIWTDGCEEGELPSQVTSRLDQLISKIRQIQAPHLKDDAPSDIIVVAHGHILRAFTKRWLGYELSERLLLMLEPGGVGILTYDHKSLEEPAMLVGLGFPIAE